MVKRIVRMVTQYPVPGTRYLVSGTQYLVPCTRYLFRQLLRHVAPLVTVLLLASPLLADPNSGSDPKDHGLDVPTLLFVFLLATFIGLGVITRVSRLLHTPLMSLTNAISAIAVVGAIGIAGAETSKDHPLYLTILGAIALFASMTNIVSGFLLTDRMVKMFKSQEGGKA